MMSGCWAIEALEVRQPCGHVRTQAVDDLRDPARLDRLGGEFGPESLAPGVDVVVREGDHVAVVAGLTDVAPEALHELVLHLVSPLGGRDLQGPLDGGVQVVHRNVGEEQLGSQLRHGRGVGCH